MGVVFGATIVNWSDSSQDLIAACMRFDAGHQLEIISSGYSYDPFQRSVVAFFPAYPLLARQVALILGLTWEEGALVAANVFLVGAFVFLARWTRLRWPDATSDQRFFVLALFGLWPMGLFFRMPYAESLFLLISLGLLIGMAQRWPLAILAVLAGLLTAVRPVGLAATAAFVWHIVEQPGPRIWLRFVKAALWAPMACWGLFAYMLYQQLAFGNPLAFAQTQDHWTMAVPEVVDWRGKAVALVTLEPIINAYNSESMRYWHVFHGREHAFLSVMFWNPIFFIIAGLLVAWGQWKGYLTAPEVVFGLSLLAIPYLTRAYEMSMASHGRFAAIVIPAFLVLGRVFANANAAGRAAVCIVLTTLLILFTSLFSGGHLFF